MIILENNLIAQAYVGEAISNEILCISLKEILVNYCQGERLSETDKTIVREGRKFLTKVLFEGKIETHREEVTPIGDFSTDEINIFNVNSSYEFARLVWQTNNDAIRYSRTYASIFQLIENGASYERLLTIHKHETTDMFNFFYELRNQIGDRMPPLPKVWVTKNVVTANK